jgi:DNA-binding XRE family transcriptional regulator
MTRTGILPLCRQAQHVGGERNAETPSAHSADNRPSYSRLSPIPTIVGRPRGTPPVPSPAVLGDEIRKVRNDAGLTQEELAFRSHLSRNYISLLELNQKSPTFDTLLSVCTALGVRASVLVAKVEREMEGQPRRRS